MCRHASRLGRDWPRSYIISSKLNRDIAEIRPVTHQLWSRFGRDCLCVDTPGHASTQFPVPHRHQIDICFGRVSSVSSHAPILPPEMIRQERIGSYGAEKPHEPHLRTSDAVLLPRPISPISQFAPAGLVHTIGTLNPIHMQPPVQNKAIVRPLKRCR